MAGFQDADAGGRDSRMDQKIEADYRDAASEGEMMERRRDVVEGNGGENARRGAGVDGGGGGGRGMAVGPDSTESNEGEEEGWETASEEWDSRGGEDGKVGVSDVGDGSLGAEIEKLKGMGLVEKTQEEIETDRQSVLAGALEAKAQGNARYAEGEYVEALKCYSRALDPGLDMFPDDLDLQGVRAMCYSNRAICFIQLLNFDAAVKECSKALELNPDYVKALMRRAQAQEKLEHFDEAILDWKKVVELDPSNIQAKTSIARLMPLAEQKREKLKKEMLDKLKEAGNAILGRFGMSVDNFKSVQDPATGSYSIQFQR